MKRHWIEYAETWQNAPMAFWVHREVDAEHWFQATRFEPPAPAVEPGKGYPIYFVECDGFTFEFSSLPQIERCIDILSRKAMPSSLELSGQRGTSKGPNSHWLSRLPQKATPWKYRQKAVAYLRQVLDGLRNRNA